MGIYYTAKIVVGLPREELLGFLEDEEILDKVSEYSYYFDSRDDKDIIGFTLLGSDEEPVEVNLSKLNESIPKLVSKFVDVFGKIPQVFLTVDVT